MGLFKFYNKFWKDLQERWFHMRSNFIASTSSQNETEVRKVVSRVVPATEEKPIVKPDRKFHFRSDS